MHPLFSVSLVKTTLGGVRDNWDLVDMPPFRLSSRTAGEVSGRQSPAAFYDAHFPLVYAFFARRTPDTPTAEDLTAETFERLAVAWPDFEPQGGADVATRVWVYRVAGNVLRNAWRSEVRREARGSAWSADQLGVADPRTEVENRLLLGHALAALAPDDRNLLGLRFWEELSAPEIALILNITPREVYTRVEHCLRALRRELAPEHEVNHGGF